MKIKCHCELMQVVSYTQYYKTFLPAVTIVRRWFTEWRQDPTADKMLSLSVVKSDDGWPSLTSNPSTGWYSSSLFFPYFFSSGNEMVMQDSSTWWIYYATCVCNYTHMFLWLHFSCLLLITCLEYGVVTGRRDITSIKLRKF